MIMKVMRVVVRQIYRVTDYPIAFTPIIAIASPTALIAVITANQLKKLRFLPITVCVPWNFPISSSVAATKRAQQIVTQSGHQPPMTNF
jgi:hypothetical protein